MIEVRQTAVYAGWFAGLRDRQASWGGRLRTADPFGPGYRAYFVQKGELLVVLLAGGDKSTQERDIRIARELARDL